MFGDKIERPSFDGFADLEDSNFKAEPVRKSLTAEQHQERASIVNGGETSYEEVTCKKCKGRGELTYGYVNFQTYPCKLCKGTGKVTARRIKAVEAAKKARETQAKNLVERRAAFVTAHKEEIAFLTSATDSSDFYRSLWEQIQQRGELSDKQLASVRKGMATREARKAEAAAKAANAPVVDIANIEYLFSVASGNGLKRPVFRALDGIEVSKAPETGQNAGALYVKENGTYVGKIVTGRFLARSEASPKVLARLLEIAADPLGQAKLYGKQTGVCCCCGRGLTDPVSIEAGIGPICESRWGL